MEQGTVTAVDAAAEVAADVAFADMIVQSLGIYGLAIVISLIMAVSIRGIVATLAATQKKSAPSPKPAVAGTAPAAIEEGVPADDVAAIAAAVASVFSAHRIVHIRPLQDTHAWATEGRWQHQTSHQPSPRHHR